MLLSCTPAVQPEPAPVDPVPVDPVPDPEKEYSFQAQPSALTFEAEGGSQSIELTTDAAWVAFTQDDWITVSPAKGVGNKTITITVESYDDLEYNRRGIVELEVDGEGKGGLEINVVQYHAEEEPPVGLDVVVYTGSASKVTATSANITCNYTGATGGVYDRGIYFGTSASDISRQVGLNSSSASDAYYTVSLSSLEPETTYYYKAYVTVLNSSGVYVDVFGSVKSFTTESSAPVTVNGLQFLNCYEVPSLDLVNTESCSNTGGELYGNTNWFNYLTNDDNRMVITHTFRYGGKILRNYTCMVDKNKKAPLWSAFVMQDDAYPDNGVGRTGSWKTDPGIPESWQSCFSSSGYSRGHFVASNYRQVCSDANKQTFYYTNQALQFQTSFNDGVWNSLEQAVKASAPSGRDTLYVTVGVLYEGSGTLDGVPVPSHFYKLLMKCSFGADGSMTAARGVAYLFENKSQKGKNYSQFATTIDAVEQRAGFDFFANVPAELQAAAEKMSSPLW